jgi:uncharacterized metal-binding protein YceD (DUF177 family)
MNSLQEFNIPYLGLKIGVHNFEFNITSEFFEHFEYSQIDACNLQLHLTITKQSTMLILDFLFSGNINTVCDRCNEALQLPITTEHKLFAKLGTANNFDDPEIITINENEGIIAISQFVYEFINLDLPLRKVHSEETKNQCNKSVLQKLEDTGIKQETENIDPRWAALKGLKNN